MNIKVSLKPLAKAGEEIRGHFDKVDAAREEGIKASREMTRCAATAIRSIHQGKAAEAEKFLEDGIAILQRTRKRLAAHPEILFAGFFQSGEKELAEGWLTYHLIIRREVISPSRHEFDPVSWLHGLAESAGELRRHILEILKQGKLEESEAYLDVMQEIYYLLNSMNYTDGVTRGLRRQTDYVRALVEKTASDVTSATIHRGVFTAKKK